MLSRQFFLQTVRPRPQHIPLIPAPRDLTKDMTDSKLAIAEAILGYNFSRKTLALEALMMDSGPSGIKAVVWHKGQRHEVPKNTRLAVVGDGLLDSVLAEAWYGTDESKGRPHSISLPLIASPRAS